MDQQLGGGVDALPTDREIRINVGRQADGCTYALDARSAVKIAKQFPGVRPAPSIYVGYTTRDDFELLHGPMWRQIAALLIGRDPEAISRDFDVTIYDPRADRVVYRLPSEQAQ